MLYIYPLQPNEKYNEFIMLLSLYNLYKHFNISPKLHNLGKLNEYFNILFNSNK